MLVNIEVRRECNPEEKKKHSEKKTQDKNRFCEKKKLKKKKNHL